MLFSFWPCSSSFSVIFCFLPLRVLPLLLPLAASHCCMPLLHLFQYLAVDKWRADLHRVSPTHTHTHTHIHIQIYTHTGPCNKPPIINPARKGHGWQTYLYFSCCLHDTANIESRMSLTTCGHQTQASANGVCQCCFVGAVASECFGFSYSGLVLPSDQLPYARRDLRNSCSN